MGEIWDDATQWLDGTQFDGVMNYRFTAPTLTFVAGDRIRMDLVEQPHYYPYPALDAASYGDNIQHLLALYPWETQRGRWRIWAIKNSSSVDRVCCRVIR